MMIVRWNSIIYIMLVWWGLYEWCYGYSFFWSQTHSHCIMYILTCPTYEWKNKTSTRSYTPRAQMKNPQQEAPALRKGCVLVSVWGTSFFSCVVVSDLETIQPEQSSNLSTGWTWAQLELTNLSRAPTNKPEQSSFDQSWAKIGYGSFGQFCC